VNFIYKVQTMMKLYEYPGAPNPRRVKIFLAEKDLPYESVHCDIGKGEHKTPEFLEKYSSGKIPVLELDDGRCLGESVAICRYLEAIQPEPNLFGRDPFELGFIEMRNRQIELELWMQVGISWVNGPIVAKLGRFTQNPLAKELSDKSVVSYYERLNTELASTAYVAGDRFTIADISLLTAVDFATALVGLKPAESNEVLWAWHRNVSERDSVAAN
jgi:glutathione S-transferase